MYHDLEMNNDSSQLLCAYLLIDVVNFDKKEYNAAFGAKGALHTPTLNVWGASRDWEHVMSLLCGYSAMSPERQQASNAQYYKSTNPAQRKMYTDNAKSLETRNAKIAAIHAHPNGIEITAEVGFSLVEDGTDSAENIGNMEQDQQQDRQEQTNLTHSCTTSPDKLLEQRQIRRRIEMHTRDLPPSRPATMRIRRMQHS